MDGRQRAIRALKGEPVDRVPIYSHFRNPKAIEKITGLDFHDDPFKATAAAYRALEIDMTKEISVPVTEAPPGYYINATTYGYNRERPEVETLPEFVEAVGKLPDFETLKNNFDFHEEVEKIRNFLDHQQDAVDDTALITGQMPGCFDANLEKYGYETFMSALLMEPGAAEHAIRYHAGLRHLHAKAFVEAGRSDVIMYCDDIASLDGLLAHPDLMRSLWLPHMRFAVEPLMDAGIFVIYHSDGDIRALYPDISDSGFKGQHPLELKANMDPVKIKAEFGDMFVLFGGLCQVSILPYGTVEEIQVEVRRLLDGTGGKGYFIGSSGMTGPDIPPENALAWIYEAAEYGKKWGEL